MNGSDYLDSVLKQFEYYKLLGEKAMLQLDDEALFKSENEDSNSVAVIVKHMWGNMMSRWTDFLTTDGEKESRQRDAEFVADLRNREEVMNYWNEGWACCLNAIRGLSDSDLDKVVYIRNQGHSVPEAINRQLAHYPYHVGQIVNLAKMYKKDAWTSLSIPKGNSQKYNEEKFQQEKSRKHFTYEYLSPDSNQ